MTKVKSDSGKSPQTITTSVVLNTIFNIDICTIYVCICSTTIHIYKKVLCYIINVNSNTIIIKQVFFLENPKKRVSKVFGISYEVPCHLSGVQNTIT